VFDPQGGHWYLLFLGPITLAVTLLLGLCAYLGQRREYHATLARAVLRPALEEA
jgi:hypothetical protein